MKTKHLTKHIFFLLLMPVALWWSGCGSECSDPCPPLGNQPEPYLLTKWEKERFPYDNFKSLTFKVTEPGRVDTVKLFRIKYDSFYTNMGDAITPPCGCPQVYEARYINYTAVFGELQNHDRLRFQNQGLGQDIQAFWHDDSVWVSHLALNQFIGKYNDSLNHDTASILGRQFAPTINWTGLAENLDSVSYMYNYNFGYIFIRDIKNKKQWEFISAEHY
jgi:hypothetical protein